MKMRTSRLRLLFPVALALFFGAWITSMVCGQAVPYARTLPKSKEEVDAALKEMQAYAGQKLPIVDGFVAVDDQPLSRYERAFYQLSIDLVPDAPGATIIRVTAKITAWYADRDPSKSGYQVLPSNGRLELDLLDRLSDKLGRNSLVSASRSAVQAPRPKLDLSAGSGGSVVAFGRSGSVPSAAVSVSGGDEVAALRMKPSSASCPRCRLLSLAGSLVSLKKNSSGKVAPKHEERGFRPRS